MVSAGINFGPESIRRTGTDLAEELQELKRERNAVILAHNYQVPELQDAADFVGDSLGLSYQAAKTDADVILFCGVHFMAETAKIINPTKRVILPDLDAGCSLSESCPPEKLAQFLKEHADKNYYVIAYINCSAGVKAQADVICTSGNADKIVCAAPIDRNILFVPDQNLGAWVMERTGRKMDLWQGTCYVHVEFTARSIGKILEEYPDAPVVAHPECTYAVRMLANEVCSTEKMIAFCKQSPAQEIIVVTEAGILHRLKKEIPGKTFIPGPTDNCFCGECRFMKMNTLEKAYDALLNMEPEITLPESVRKRAEAPILRMLELSK
jgi:quinolinate synthase